MGHGEYLAVHAELLHQAAHGFSHRAAHAGVHLVKNQGLHRTQLAGHHRYRQGNPRQFTARGHFAHGSGRAARMAGDQKANVFQPRLGRRFKRRQRHLKRAALHAQALHGFGDGSYQFWGCFLALFGNRQGFRLVRLGGGLLGGFQGGEVGGRIESRQFFFPGGEQRGQFIRCAFVTPGQ